MSRSIIEKMSKGGALDRNKAQTYILNQLKTKNVSAVADFFSQIALQKDRRLNQVVDHLVRMPEWTDFVLDLREEASMTKLEDEGQEPPVQFLVSHPRRLYPGQEATLMVHVYAPAFYRKRREAEVEETLPESVATARQIIVTPRLQGCEFFPQSRRFPWRHDSRKISFQMTISTRQPHFKLDRPRPGRVSFFLDSVAIGEVGLQVYLAAGEGENELRRQPVTLATGPYRGVFASYAAEDRDAVDAMIESAGAVLGDHYVWSGKLRRGKHWREELGDMFGHSDVFQLFWTPNARKSEKVRREWTQVLQCKKACHIRPVYWIEPLRSYPPPSELKRLPFTRMDM